MAAPGYGAGDFVLVAKCAWTVYKNVHESGDNFHKLNIDVESLLVTIGSLDKGHTQDLMISYVESEDTETRRVEVEALRIGLNSVIMPFYTLFQEAEAALSNPNKSKAISSGAKSGIAIYVEGPTVEPVPRKKRPWRRWTDWSWIQVLKQAFAVQDMSDLRSRFTLQATNLNIFMTRLTHTQMQRQTELLTLRLAEQSLLNNNFHYKLVLDEADDDFRRDVARYIEFLQSGGKPFTDGDLRQRKAETRHTYSTVTTNALGHSGRRRSESERMSEYKRMAARREKKERSDREEWRLEIERGGIINEAFVDDDARVKLAAAQTRLALLDWKSLQQDQELEVRFAVPDEERPSALVRRTSEQVLIPHVKRPDELRRSASTTISCNVCRGSIPANKSYYQCESGICGKRGNTFDICRACYDDGQNCPGYDRGVCEEMEKVVWKEID